MARLYHLSWSGGVPRLNDILTCADASAVPDGASGRLTFIMLSMFSMLVYAYYSSAIVSALMAAGGGGPTSLRDLADSRYALASEDYDWMRYLMFDVNSTYWNALVLHHNPIPTIFINGL